MSEQNQVSNEEADGMADAIAATATIAVVVAAVVYWLSGFPA
jgi:hypothetical protein